MHDFTIPFGPVHPAIGEPTCLRVSLEGNYVRDARIRLGYTHRGMEKLLEGKTVEQGLYVVQHVCGICTFAHEGCYTITIEKMLGYDAPKKVKFIRSLIAELERIHSHSLWSALMMHEIGYETMFAYFMREREHILEIFERLTGGRVHHAINKIGGVRHDITEDDIRFVLKKMNKVEKKYSLYSKLVEKDSIIRARMVDVGTITKKNAKKYSLVGPIARASGIKEDIRRKNPYEAYKDIDFEVITAEEGDTHARSMVRLNEIMESIKIIRQLLNNMPQEKIPEPGRFITEEGRETGRVEAPRGENFHFIRIKDKRIDRIRIRPPTFSNISILTELLKNREVGDVPVILASLDPCFACMERVIVVKEGKTEVLTENDFRRKYT